MEAAHPGSFTLSFADAALEARFERDYRAAPWIAECTVVFADLVRRP